MNGYEKHRFLQQFENQTVRDLIDMTAFEMVEGGEADIQSAFDFAQNELGLVTGWNPELTPEIRNAVLHIVHSMTEGV